MYFKFQKILLKINSLISNSQGSLFSSGSHSLFIQRHSEIAIVILYLKCQTIKASGFFFYSNHHFIIFSVLFLKCIYFSYRNAVTVQF